MMLVVDNSGSMDRDPEEKGCDRRIEKVRQILRRLVLDLPGEFLIQRVFAPGLTLNWNELTRHATGAELSPKAFAEDIKMQNAN